MGARVLTRPMKLTKWEHACMVFEIGDERLVLDPGGYTSTLEGIENVVAIVITHEHADHWTKDQLERILSHNPAAQLFSTEATAIQAREAGVSTPISIVTPGDTVTVGAFTLRVFGGEHAVIHSSIPVIDNVGVLINDTFYYPGDSYFVPDVTVDLLAAPASAPWLKIGEAMDFVLAVAPKRAVQSHEMVNSAIGNGMAKARLAWATEQGGGTFTWLEPGDSFEV